MVFYRFGFCETSSDSDAQTILDIEKAVEFIAENLPEESGMRVTHDEVRLLLEIADNVLSERGIASYGDIDMEAEAAALRNKTVVAHEDDLVDELVRRSQESNLGLDVLDIVCVTDLANQYMKGIGAIGDQITGLEGE